MLSMVSNASLIFLALSSLLFSVLASWNLFKAVESSCSKIRKLTRILPSALISLGELNPQTLIVLSAISGNPLF